MDKKHPIVISLGGSLIVPPSGIDLEFLKDFNKFIREKTASGWRLFIVVGGGSTARHYIDAAKKTVGTITDWDLDYIGIHTTRLNAHLIRTIFHDIAHPRIIENYEKKIPKLKENLVIAAGWEPGHSTDFDAVILARDYKAKIIINMSNTKGIYSADPNKDKNARLITDMKWTDLEKLIKGDWKPGANYPFDPSATKFAKKLGITLFSVGRDLQNLGNLLSGENYTGTKIE